MLKTLFVFNGSKIAGLTPAIYFFLFNPKKGLRLSGTQLREFRSIVDYIFILWRICVRYGGAVHFG